MGRSSGARQVVPQEQLSVMVSRPERADYGPKLLGSRYRWNTHVGATQAQRVSAVTIPKWTEMEMSTWARCCKTPPVEPRTRKSAIAVVALPRRMRQACRSPLLGPCQRVEWSNHDSAKRKRKGKRTAKVYSRATGDGSMLCWNL